MMLAPTHAPQRPRAYAEGPAKLTCVQVGISLAVLQLESLNVQTSRKSTESERVYGKTMSISMP